MRYRAQMRSLLVLAVCSAACSMARPAPDRSPASWAQGQRLVLEGKPSVASGNMGGVGPDLFSGALETELRAAGFRVLSSGDDNDLHLRYLSVDRSNAAAAVSRAGETVDEIHVDGDQIGCISLWWGEGNVQTDNAACFARGILNQLLDSPRVAHAAEEARKAPPPAPAPAPVPALV